MPEPTPVTLPDPRPATGSELRQSLVIQLQAAEPVIIANGWMNKTQVESVMSRALASLTVTPLAGRSLLAQFLLDLHVLSREQVNELDTIAQVQKSMPDFNLMRKLGSGGMGTVFLAKHLPSDKTVALKTINARLAQEDDFVSRFHRESRSIQTIEHPHIARIIATGESSDGHCWLAMEYIEGPSLMNLLRDHRVLPEAYALQITRQVAQGLGHVWQRAKLVHRDLKPENVLVARARGGDELFPMSDEAKLIDFGLVKSNQEDERLTQTGMTIGTPLYMSPEQVRGEELDCRSDIYGLGATLYHLLTGSTPYTGSSPGTIMSAHLTQPVPDPGDKVPGLSMKTRSLVMTCMAKSVKDRFRTFEALEQACAEAMNELAKRTQTGPKLLRKPMVLKNAIKRSGEFRPEESTPSSGSNVLPPGSGRLPNALPPALSLPPANAPEVSPAPASTGSNNSSGNPQPRSQRPPQQQQPQRQPAPKTDPPTRADSKSDRNREITGRTGPHEATKASGRLRTNQAASPALEPRQTAPVPTTVLGPQRDINSSAAFQEPPASPGIGMTPYLVLGAALIALVAYLLMR